MLFLRETENIDGFEAILELRKELSTLAGGGSVGELDPNLPDLVIQVPEEADRGGVLPGAPEVVFDTEFGVKGYANVAELSNYMKESRDFSDSDQERLQGYFQDMETVIGSFVSIAITPPWVFEGMRNGEAPPRPLAVLNIHRKTARLLALKEQTTLFSELIGPFRSLLYDLIETWCNRKKISGAIQSNTRVIQSDHPQTS